MVMSTGQPTQPEAKLISGSNVVLVEMTVVDEYTLGELIRSIVGQPGDPVVGFRLADGVRQLTARGEIAVEHVGQRIATLLSGKTGPHNGDDVRLGEDCLEDHSSGAVDDHDRLLVDRGHCFHEIVAPVPWIEVVAISLMALDGDVSIVYKYHLVFPNRLLETIHDSPFTRIGGDKDNGCVRRLGCFCASGGVVGGTRDDGRSSTRRSLLNGLQGRDEILSSVSS